VKIYKSSELENKLMFGLGEFLGFQAQSKKQIWFVINHVANLICKGLSKNRKSIMVSTGLA